MSVRLQELVELEISMLKSLDHVNLLRLHEAFRDSESFALSGVAAHTWGWWLMWLGPSEVACT